MSGTTSVNVDSISVGVHLGNVISFLAYLYGSGISVLKEMVQNAIDEGAKNIHVSINCVTRNITAYDDGGGASKDDITQKFNRIGQSLKMGLKDKIGNKGIGNLAGLAISDEWQFLTRKNSGPIWFFSFDKKQLEKESGISLHAEKTDRKQIDRNYNFVPNSMVKLVSVSETILKQLGDQTAIENGLREAYNTILRVRKINLTVGYTDFKNKYREFLVKPIEYRGSKLDMVKYDTALGEVEFHFHHSPVPVSNPNILVNHQGVYSMPIMNFFKMKLLPREIEQYFSKGYFEGEIRLGFCVVNPERSALIPNSDYSVFADVVNTFAIDVMKSYIDQFEQANREDKWKQAANDVLRKLKSFFRNNPGLIPSILKTALTKAVGDTENPNADASGTVGIKQKKGDRKLRLNPLPPDALKKKKQESEEQKKTGLKVNKNKGRTVDFADCLGIQFVYPDEESEGFVWCSRINKGVIQINVANSVFLEVERRGRSAVERYITELVHIELTAATLSPVAAEAFKAGAEQKINSFWISTL